MSWSFLGFIVSLVYFEFLEGFRCSWVVDICLTSVCDILLDALRTSIIQDYVEGFCVDTLDSCL